MPKMGEMDRFWAQSQHFLLICSLGFPEIIPNDMLKSTVLDFEWKFILLSKWGEWANSYSLQEALAMSNPLAMSFSNPFVLNG